jgi:hypothetical protein
MIMVQELDEAGLIKFEPLSSGKFDWMFLYCASTGIEKILRANSVFSYPDLRGRFEYS